MNINMEGKNLLYMNANPITAHSICKYRNRKLFAGIINISFFLYTKFATNVKYLTNMQICLLNITQI